jgi:hypothetical protein
MRSRTIAAIIVSAYSFVTDTFAVSATTSYKFSFIHKDIIALLVFNLEDLVLLLYDWNLTRDRQYHYKSIQNQSV